MLKTSPDALNVLIVEDDLFFQKVISEALGVFHRELMLTKAQTLSEAVACLNAQETSYDLALIDLGLPDGNGLQMVRMVSDRFPATTIVVISATSEEARVLDAVRAGASGYVLKGDDNLSLPQALDQAIRGLSPISPALARYFLRLAGREIPGQTGKSVDLTPRERDLLERFAEGMTYQQAAKQMGVALSTVQTHSRGLYRKLGVRSSLQALSEARRKGLL